MDEGEQHCCKSNGVAKRAQSLCEVHRRSDYLFYCRTCDQVCCAQCVSDRLHKYHNWLDFDVVLTQKVHQFQAYLDTIELKRRRLQGAVQAGQESQQAVQADVNRQLERIRSQYRSLRSECARVLQACEQQACTRVQAAAQKIVQTHATKSQVDPFGRRTYVRHNLRKCAAYGSLVANLKERCNLNDLLRNEHSVGQLVDSIDISLETWAAYPRGADEHQLLREKLAEQFRQLDSQTQQLHNALLLALSKCCSMLAKLSGGRDDSERLLRRRVQVHEQQVQATVQMRNSAVPSTDCALWRADSSQPPRLRPLSVAKLELNERAISGFVCSDTHVFFIDYATVQNAENNNADRPGMHTVKTVRKQFCKETGRYSFGEVHILHSTAKRISSLELVAGGRLLAFFCDADRLQPAPVYLLGLGTDELHAVAFKMQNQVGPASICAAENDGFFVSVAHDRVLYEVGNCGQTQEQSLGKYRLVNVHELGGTVLHFSYDRWRQRAMAVMTDHSVHILSRQFKDLWSVPVPAGFSEPLFGSITPHGLCFLASCCQGRDKLALSVYKSDGTFLGSVGKIGMSKLSSCFLSVKQVRQFVDDDEEVQLALQGRLAFCLAFCTNDDGSARIVISEYR